METTTRPSGDCTYSALANGAIPQSGGTFTFKGSGGSDVGSSQRGPQRYESFIKVGPSPVSERTSIEARNSRQHGPEEIRVPMFSSAGHPHRPQTSSAFATNVGFTCPAKAGDGQFAVPAYILSALPPGNGGVLVQNDIYVKMPTSGLDIGIAQGEIGISATSVYK